MLDQVARRRDPGVGSALQRALPRAADAAEKRTEGVEKAAFTALTQPIIGESLSPFLVQSFVRQFMRHHALFSGV